MFAFPNVVIKNADLSLIRQAAEAKGRREEPIGASEAKSMRNEHITEHLRSLKDCLVPGCCCISYVNEEIRVDN